MERLNGKQAQSLVEAYQQVYAPILTEEMVNAAAEQWVAGCIEEGINFEEYTLDEITEAFIVDCEQPEVLNEFFGMPGAQNLGADLRQKFGQTRRAVGRGLSNLGAGVKDVAGATAQGLIGQKTTSTNPLARAGNAYTRMQTAIPRAIASGAAGFLTGRGAGGGTRPTTPTNSTVANRTTTAPVTPAPSAGAPSAGAPTRPSTPARPTGAADPRNQQYQKDRAAIATAKTPEAKAAATKKAETTGMAAWAKANPKLAAKVKPGQAGYETIQRTLNPKSADTSAAKKTGAAFNPNAPKLGVSSPAAVKSAGSEAGAKAFQRPAAVKSAGSEAGAKTPAASASPSKVSSPAATKAKVEVGGKNPADLKRKAVAAEEIEVSASKQQLDEFLGKDAADAFDKASKRVQGGLERMGVKINRQERGTVTKDEQQKKIKNNVKEDFDIFDTIIEHLISEGLTEQEALSVMVVMEDQDREEILEVLGYLRKKAGQVVRDVKDRVTGKKELVGGDAGYVRVGAPTKKGDKRIGGIGPVGSYARQDHWTSKSTPPRNKTTVSITADGKPRRY